MSSFNDEELREFADNERMKERARIMLLARELAKELDSLIVNNFLLELVCIGFHRIES